MAINLRDIELNDLDIYYELNKPNKKFHNFNGPYFSKKNLKELKEYIKLLKNRIINKDKIILENKKLIVDNNNNIIGEVNWYWKSKETNWLEVGIVIFSEENWGKGIGYNSLKIWINEIFKKHPEIIRIGLTTWSGNIGMMKLAEKLKFKKEAAYKKARIVNGKYYDSVSYGILKNEWLK